MTRPSAPLLGTVAAVVIAGAALIGCSQGAPAGFQCPSPKLERADSKEPLKAKDFQEIRGILGDFPRENAILEARAYLASKAPDVTDAMASDYFDAAYCETFVHNRDMTDAEKPDRMERWSRIVTTTILDHSRSK